MLVILRCWLAILIKILLFSYRKKIKSTLLLLTRGLLFYFLNFSFLSLNFIRFYIFFEISLIPLVFIILGWGYQVERVGAVFYLVIYTLVGSLPLLMVLLSIFSFNKNLGWIFFKNNFNFSFIWVIFFVVVIFSFFIKLPMYLVHLWLPKAHVEAPGFGSIVLAAVLLKLRGYGVYRVLVLFFLKANILLNCFFFMALVGSVLAAWICVTQTDTKSLIAYSSVRHMGILMSGLITQVWDGVTGVFLISLAHGFCSSALFFLSGQRYDQIFSRQLLISRGRLKIFLCSSIFWILFLLVNFSVPPFLRIFGELFVIGGLFWVNFFFWAVSGLNIMVVSFFCIYFFMVSIHGRLNFFKSLIPEVDLLFMLRVLHFVPLVGLVLKLILFLCLNSLKKIKNCGFLDKSLFQTIVGLSFLFFFVRLILYFFIGLQRVYFLELDIFSLTKFHISAVFIFDFFSVLFFFTVMIISSMIYFFSQYYIDQEKNIKVFIGLLRLFVLSIVFLIFSPSLIFMLLGWDGLGVTSYLLVVYYRNYRRSVAGLLTFLVNRVGDVLFFFSICFFSLTIDWRIVDQKFYFWVVGLLIGITFITKRAQVPFSSWLPAAISAPTPVSSLVHSSTLVTAGVYLMVRFSSLLVGQVKWLLVVSIFTICVSGILANLDWDLKKIIAFSTLSQLGFMVSAYSCFLVIFCFFHLITHALFKASLFICSGVVIHSHDNSQEFRNVRAIGVFFPVIKRSILVCLLCLCGFPFTSGFFSKDIILDGGFVVILFFFFFVGGVLLTVFYSIRFRIFLLFNKIFTRNKSFVLRDSVYWVLFPIFFLVFLALRMGNFWAENFIFLSSLIFVSGGWKLFYFLSLILRGWVCVAGLLNNFFFVLKKFFFRCMWFLMLIFSFRRFTWIFYSSLKYVKIIDQGWLEQLGPSGLLTIKIISVKIFNIFFSFFLPLLVFFFLVM